MESRPYFLAHVAPDALLSARAQAKIRSGSDSGAAETDYAVIGSELKNISLAPAMTFNINDLLRINSDSTLKPRRVASG